MLYLCFENPPLLKLDQNNWTGGRCTTIAQGNQKSSYCSWHLATKMSTDMEITDSCAENVPGVHAETQTVANTTEYETIAVTAAVLIACWHVTVCGILTFSTWMPFQCSGGKSLQFTHKCGNVWQSDMRSCLFLWAHLVLRHPTCVQWVGCAMKKHTSQAEFLNPEPGSTFNQSIIPKHLTFCALIYLLTAVS